MYIFSKTTNSFYPQDLRGRYEAAGTWPDDGVTVSEDVFMLFSGTAPEGKMCGTDESGYPAWVDISLPDIKTVRENKLAEINRWRNDRENANYILNFNGNDWDYSKITQQRLEMAAELARQDSLPAGFFWTDAHNNDVPMNAAGLLALNNAIAGAIFAKVLEIHIRQRQMKTEVEKLTDVTKIINYPIHHATGN